MIVFMKTLMLQLNYMISAADVKNTVVMCRDDSLYLNDVKHISLLEFSFIDCQQDCNNEEEMDGIDRSLIWRKDANPTLLFLLQ